MAERARPVLVWLIFLLVLFGTAVWLFTIVVFLSGTVPLDAETQAAVGEITAADYVVGFFQMAVYLAAAIALFMMRKAALYFFGAALCLDFGVFVWNVLDVPDAAQMATGGDMEMTAGVIGLGITVAICLYAVKLTLSEQLQ